MKKRRRKQKKGKFTKFEKVLFAITIMVGLSYPFMSIFAKSTLSEMNYKLESNREKRNSHPAKKVFQAIRIEVNNELEEFERALRDSLEILNTEGRIAVITFHSLEDRICKKIFKEVTAINPVVKGMPNIPEEMLPDYKLITNKPIIPSDLEIRQNSRSKPSKLRVIEKIK